MQRWHGQIFGEDKNVDRIAYFLQDIRFAAKKASLMIETSDVCLIELVDIIIEQGSDLNKIISSAKTQLKLIEEQARLSCAKERQGNVGEKCLTCLGSGYVFYQPTGSYAKNQKCPTCGGSGIKTT